MPSLPLSNDVVSSESPKENKFLKKKKEKKNKKHKNDSISEMEALSSKSKSKNGSKESKKWKKCSDEEASKEKKKMKARVEEDDEEAEVEKKQDPNAVSNFRISEPLRKKLQEKGIESLFPIQAMTFNTILDGSDLVVRSENTRNFQKLPFQHLA